MNAPRKSTFFPEARCSVVAVLTAQLYMQLYNEHQHSTLYIMWSWRQFNIYATCFGFLLIYAPVTVKHLRVYCVSIRSGKIGVNRTLHWCYFIKFILKF